MKLITEYIKKNWLWFIIIGILIFLLFQSDYRANKNYNRVTNNLEIQKDSTRYYKLKNGQEVATKEALLVTNKELRNQVFIKDDSLKLMTDKFNKVQSAIVIDTETLIKEVEIRYKDPVQFEFSKEFTKNNEWYFISGVSDQNGIIINDLGFKDKIRIVTGTKRKWFSTEVTTDVSLSNPYSRVEGIQSQTTTVKDKLFGVGLYTGYDVVNGKIGAGVGVTFNLFKF